MKELSSEIKTKVAQLKAKGNPVKMADVEDVTYVYFGLLREDLATIKALAIKEGKRLTEAVGDKINDQEVAQEILSTLDDMEDNLIISFAVVDPQLTPESVKKFPTGTAKHLKDLIFRASGEYAKVSEPISL